ncbi:6-phosphogluconolactonase [bacterium]|nr:6-phosphogluconolactonase [bacterium]
MQIETLTDEASVAQAAADWLARQAREAIASRGQFLLAVSGGKTPWIMLQRLALEDLPWEQVHFFQIDERVAPAGHADRNLTHLRASLQAATKLPATNIHAMPVESLDLEIAAADYTNVLQQLAGKPPVLDVVHLGLGTDGHTASLVPDDPVLDVTDRDVAITGEYQGRQRMTLTYPMLNRSRKVLWLATGAAKREMLQRLLAADSTIPAGRVAQSQAVLLTDQTLTS